MMRRLPMKPSVQSGREISRHIVGNVTIVVYDEIKSTDLVEYAFVAAVFKEGDGEPQLYFTSEKNTSPIPHLLESLGVESAPTGSHFFCAFDVDGHSNYGASDGWADADTFIQEVNGALQAAFPPNE